VDPARVAFAGMGGRLALTACCVALTACAQPPAAPAPPSAALGLRVLLTKPAEPETRVQLPVALVEIAGVALTPDATRHDIVLTLDFSSSAFEPTGRDVDGDGVIGVRKPWKPAVGTTGLRASPLDWTTDPDDSVVGAELAATRTLLTRLDPATTQVALLAFGSSVRRILPLATPESAQAALDGADLGALIGGTNVSAALERGARLLAAGSVPATRRSIILITDGFPNLPPPQRRAEERVQEQAERLAAAGVRVHVLAIVAQGVEPRPVLETLARLTGGSFERVDDPTELPVRLANAGLSAIESVEVRNTTTGAAGLAVRVLPDGRFDAFVPLTPGENVIEVRGHAAGASSPPLRRRIRYEPPKTAAVGASPEAGALLETLRQRTAELELLAELRARRQQRHRELRIVPESP
jgi:von Willebrand factor type A domain